MFGLVINLTILGLVVSSPPFSINPADHGDDSRIVDGKEIDISEAPYQVALVDRGQFACGGSIIGESLILTSAHCFYSKDPKNYQIRAGSSSHKKGGVQHKVQEIVIHPEYDFEKYINDLAVLKLAKPLKLNDKVKLIELIEAGNELNGGEPVQVSGWGSISEGGPLSKILKMVTLPIVDQKVCHGQYASVRPITSEMVCAGEAGKAACNGDSGGPMVYNNKLAGVVAWSRGCARPGKPTVFMRVSSYRTWLDETLAKLKGDADVQHRFGINIDLDQGWDAEYDDAPSFIPDENEYKYEYNDEENDVSIPCPDGEEVNDVSDPPAYGEEVNYVSDAPAEVDVDDVWDPPADENDQGNDVP